MYPSQAIVLNRSYTTGPMAGHIDWIAGGNFDGYIFQLTLIFREDGIVEEHFSVVDQSRYDDWIQDTTQTGNYQFSDHGTITVQLGERKMRGLALGEDGKLLVFDNGYGKPGHQHPLCYVLT